MLCGAVTGVARPLSGTPSSSPASEACRDRTEAARVSAAVAYVCVERTLAAKSWPSAPGARFPNSETLRLSEADAACELAVAACTLRADIDSCFLEIEDASTEDAAGAVSLSVETDPAGADGGRVGLVWGFDEEEDGSSASPGGAALDVDAGVTRCNCDVDAAVSKSGGGCSRSKRDDDANAMASAPYGTPKRENASLDEMTLSCSAVGPVLG